jgi:hypothetical protein
MTYGATTDDDDDGATGAGAPLINCNPYSSLGTTQW